MHTTWATWQAVHYFDGRTDRGSRRREGMVIKKLKNEGKSGSNWEGN